MMNNSCASQKRGRDEEEGIDKKLIVSITVMVMALALWLELFYDEEDSDTSDTQSEVVDGEDIEMADGEDIEMADGEDSDTSESDSASNTQGREETSSVSLETSAGQSQNSANSTYVAKKKSKLSADSAVGFQRFEAQTEKKFTSALMRLMDALLDYLRRSKKRLDPKEVIDELNGIPDLVAERCTKL